MRKIVKTILAVACFAGIILTGCENADGSCDIIWTISWLAAACLSAYGFKKVDGSTAQ